MAEPLPETQQPQTLVDPADVGDPELERKNILFGWALFGLFLLLFAGTVGIAFIYLWLD
jgi:hypothetical protein